MEVPGVTGEKAALEIYRLLGGPLMPTPLLPGVSGSWGPHSGSSHGKGRGLCPPLPPLQVSPSPPDHLRWSQCPGSGSSQVAGSPGLTPLLALD